MDEVSTLLYTADQFSFDLFSFNVFVWAIALLCHAACTNFGGLFVVRFILGACEGAITPGFMIVGHQFDCKSILGLNITFRRQVTSMFYTREEQTKRVGYWCKFQLAPFFVRRLTDVPTSSDEWLRHHIPWLCMLRFSAYSCKLPRYFLSRTVRLLNSVSMSLSDRLRALLHGNGNVLSHYMLGILC